MLIAATLKDRTSSAILPLITASEETATAPSLYIIEALFGDIVHESIFKGL